MNNREITEKITQEFVAEISEKKITSDIPKYDCNVIQVIEDRTNQLIENVKSELDTLSTIRVQYYRPLGAFHKLFSHVTVFIKKIIRKCLKFLIEPITNETEQCRSVMETTVKDLIEIVENQNLIIYEMNRELAEIRKEINRLQENENNSID